MGPREHHLLSALAVPGFRRLFSVRMVGQYGDGVFQASLAGAVLFNPEHAAHSSDIAAAFAVLLLPYSVLGPFAGVLIDRWWRRSILAKANLIRAGLVVGVAAEIAAGVSGVAFYATALVVISISRFVLAALGASLPRVVDDDILVTANALTSTVGTICAALGGGTALAVRALIGAGNTAYALTSAIALVPYLVAAVVAAWAFDLSALGPTAAERRRKESAADVVRGLVTGARRVWQTDTVRNALAMLGIHRLLYGVWLVSTVLLYRNYFTGSQLLRAGLAGLSQVVVGIAVGGVVASFLTPWAFRRVGPANWPAMLLACAGCVEVVLVAPYEKATLLGSALVLSFASQGIKISVDTLAQRDIDDAFRGRVFSIYDMLFNLAAVLAAALTALALPDNGHSPVSVYVVASAWVATALGYLLVTIRAPRPSCQAAENQLSARSLG